MCLSSLASTPEFLNSDIAPAFTRAFARAKAYLCEASAAEIAAAQKPLFPNIDEAVLADCIASYQEIGCWRGSIDITSQGYEAMLDIFDFDNKLKAIVSVSGIGCPGYGSTSKMLAESSVCLALDKLSNQNGVLTPSTAFGNALINRLEKNAELNFKIKYL